MQEMKNMSALIYFQVRVLTTFINPCDENQIPEHWTQNGAYFKTIHCHCVMEHVTDIFAMAKNIEKITKVGGVLYITIPFSWRYLEFPWICGALHPRQLTFYFHTLSSKLIYVAVPPEKRNFIVSTIYLSSIWEKDSQN